MPDKDTFEDDWNARMANVDTRPQEEPLQPLKPGRAVKKPAPVAPSISNSLSDPVPEPEPAPEPAALRSGLQDMIARTIEDQPPKPQSNPPAMYTFEEGAEMKIEFEAAGDREAKEIMVTEITTFNFNRVAIRPRSTIAANNIKKTMPGICDKHGLRWNPYGKTLILYKKHGANYDGKTMDAADIAFIKQIVGFFSKETVIR